jgi:hypothetical protein
MRNRVGFLPMNLLPRILVMCSAVVIALPPGWCCLGFRAAAAASEPAEVTPPPKSCCHPEPVPVPPDGPVGQSRGAPTLSCCCQDKAAVRGDQKVATDGPGLSTPLVSPVVHWTGPLTGFREKHFTLFSLAPPLQVLHCTWLC